jgi:hypothetical protein
VLDTQRRFRRPRAGLVATAWFVGLALLIAGPLLGRGQLILLDFPAGPAAPRVAPLPLPSSGDLGNVIPLTATHALLREVWTPLPEKLFLLLPVFVGGLGLYVLVRRSLGVGAAAGVYGGTLYVVNPFVWDRYLAGHVHFLVAYALLPWALLPLVRALDEPSRRTAVVVGVWLAVLAAISVHIAGLYVVLVALTAALAFGARRARLAFAALAGVIGAVVSTYWLLPFFFVPERRVGLADLAEYESRPDGFAIVPTLLALYGFWREEFTRPVDERPALYVFLLPILALVAAGAVVLLRSSRRRLGVLFVAAGGLGVLLAAGTSFPPTEDVFRWLFPRVPFAGAYREPQKFLALTVVAYAVLGAAGLELLRGTRRRLRVVTPAAFAAVLLYGHAMLWGLWGEVELSRYPQSWSTANRLMERRGEGRLLVLPWELYDDWSFTDGRIVANPAASFFTGREVLVGGDIGLDVPPASVDPFSYYVDDLLERDGLRALGRALAPLGVRFVAWTEEADEEELQLLARQDDLTRIYSRVDLALFENRSWRGDVLSLRAVHEREPYVEPVRDASLPLVRRLPGWDSVSALGGAAISVGERCNDGWRLGDRGARCHRGAVAAFDAPPDRSTLWRPFVGVQLLGYAIALAALALALIVVHPRRTR